MRRVWHSELSVIATPRSLCYPCAITLCAFVTNPSQPCISPCRKVHACAWRNFLSFHVPASSASCERQGLDLKNPESASFSTRSIAPPSAFHCWRKKHQVNRRTHFPICLTLMHVCLSAKCSDIWHYLLRVIVRNEHELSKDPQTPRPKQIK